MMMKRCDQSVDLLIGPMVEQVCVSQLWEGGLHCGGLFDGAVFDAMALIRRKVGESLLEGLDVEEGDGKGADATAGPSESARNFTEQGGGCPLEPVVDLVVQRKNGGQSRA
jgi:hypothetical protein